MVGLSERVCGLLDITKALSPEHLLPFCLFELFIQVYGVEVRLSTLWGRYLVDDNGFLP